MKNRTKRLLNYGGAFAPAKNIRSPNKRRTTSNNKTYHGKKTSLKRQNMNAEET